MKNIFIFVIKSRLVSWCIVGIFRIHWKLVAGNYSKKRNHTIKPRLMWGTSPILNNKYWSNAMKAAGYESMTIMRDFYGRINKKSDFDMYFNDVVEKNYNSVPKFVKYCYTQYFVFD
ncbi:MAG TPA: hypothetical protein VNX68_08350, partial [Nitrosopumilaceae archaeon]|nr:hypothetical protein [Nitrosopumilaceae archaeon]